MSVLIRGMEMPKSCRKCMISQPDGCGWVCPIIESKPIVDGRVNSRHPHCPLVHVSLHGRLIDADELKKIVANAKHMDAGIFDGKTMYSDHLCIGADYDDVCAAIDEAPTIIPEEEGET